MKKPTFNFSSNPAIKALTKTEREAVANYVSSGIDEAAKWAKLIKPMPFNINLEEYVRNVRLSLIDGSSIPLDSPDYNRGRYCTISPNLFDVLYNLKSETSIAIIKYIAYNIKFNSNIIVIDENAVDTITKSRRVFDMNIRHLCSHNVLAKTTDKDMFIVNPLFIFVGRYNEFMIHYKRLYENKDIETNKYGRIVLK